jgi:hypothetical protein
MGKDKGIKVSEKHGVNPSISICAWCGESKGIALMGKLKNDEEAPKEAIFDLEPCESCQKQMDLGITVAESKDGKRPTGRWVVVKEDKISQIIGDEDILEKTLEKRKVFVDSKLMDMLLGVAKGDKDGDKI